MTKVTQLGLLTLLMFLDILMLIIASGMLLMPVQVVILIIDIQNVMLTKNMVRILIWIVEHTSDIMQVGQQLCSNICSLAFNCTFRLYDAYYTL